LKPECWDSPLVQEEKYHEKPVKREEIKFSSLLLVCCINSLVVNYRCGTRENKNNEYNKIIMIIISHEEQ
jgi:hypothetical protein